MRADSRRQLFPGQKRLSLPVLVHASWPPTVLKTSDATGEANLCGARLNNKNLNATFGGPVCDTSRCSLSTRFQEATASPLPRREPSGMAQLGPQDWQPRAG